AVPRCGGLHRPARPLCEARRHDQGFQGAGRGQARRPPGAGVLHGRRHRGSAGESAQDARGEVAVQLELATPTRLLVSTEVDEVVAPGSEGYFGVLPGHAAFLTTLGAGELSYRRGADEHHLLVVGGFAEVSGDRVIILAEDAERPEEIDRPRAEVARQRAEQRLAGRPPSGAQEEIDYSRALSAFQRATARLQVAGRPSG